MIYFMKKILLGLVALVCSLQTYASHFTGGELRYEFNGTNYTLILRLFQACDMGAAQLPATGVVNIASTAASFNTLLTLPRISLDTLKNSCPSTPNKCLMPTSNVPGYLVAEYRANITLPSQQADWVFSYTNAARNSMVNLSTMGQMYLEATLDNSVAINSSAWLPNTPSYFIVNGATNTIPMQAVDAEGDGLQFDIIAPQQAAATNVTYAPGYSATAPFGTGGIYTINATTQQLTLKSNMMGQFALAMRVKEYRNSVLVGSYIREFSVASLPSTSGAFTYPAPASYAPFTVYTCPGQSHSITLNFTDPTITDSVYVDVTAPSIPGFTFTTTGAGGQPTGTATIGWTTPGTMNPATLPFFVVKMRVRDNGCPKAIVDYALMVRTKQCTVDSVWPGDANGDFTVNIYDPLAIAIANGQTGAARSGATTTWTAQACANWGTTFPTNSVDMKHADCDGNGTVNLTDLGAVTTNWALTHPKEGHNKQTAGPDLYFDLTGVVLKPGTTVTIPIKLGNTTTQMSDVYGLATRISINGSGSVTTPITVTTPTTWLGTSGNTLHFTKNNSTNIIDWAHARTDHQNTSGQGQIGTLTFAVPANAVPGAMVSFRFTNTKLIDKDGNDISAFNPVNGEGQVPFPVSVASMPNGVNNISVAPNPAHNTANLNIELAAGAKVEVKMLDMVGKTVYTQAAQYTAGSHTMQLPVAQIANGMYTIHISGEGWSTTPVIKFVKQ
jgi:hypothetical protein